LGKRCGSGPFPLIVGAAGLACFLLHFRYLEVAWIAWYLILNATHATGFDVDALVIQVSWEDVGSGALTLFATALALGLVTQRREPASRVVGAASIAGLVALILDVFV
jgi:hypothetical protein